MFRILLIIFLSSIPISTVQAQHALVLERLQEWNDAAPPPSGEVLKKQILTVAKSKYPQDNNCSVSDVIIEKVDPATSDRFVFRAIISQQMRNAWTVLVRLPGCDSALVRFMVMQNKEGLLRTIRVNRGISYAHDSLISDTLPLVRIGAVGALKRAKVECELGANFTLGITRIEFEEADLGPDVFGVRYKGRWAEIWPIEICDRTVEAQVEFTADGDGGAYQKIPGTKMNILPN